ncbi:MAG: acyltransferase [Deltaproteobacteria bacterium]|nr:acyltransferase [Deltaproteobacteria bacterium]
MQVQHGSRASTTLDAVRALAAFVVLIGHARNLFVVDYPELLAAGGRPSAPLYGFYFVTSLGHQAVLVFFVLSGFFIGQAVLSRHAPGSRWSWSHYLVDRVSRLYVVLLPALALTLLWDHLGATAMPSLYDGSYPANILNFAADTRHDAATFLANATFLQTITAPPLGTNGALWSLANELWYYLLFPLALRVAVTRNQRERYLCLALFAGAATLVGSEILLYFPVWLLGVALNLLPIPRLARGPAPCSRGPAASRCSGALLLTRLRPGCSPTTSSPSPSSAGCTAPWRRRARTPSRARAGPVSPCPRRPSRTRSTPSTSLSSSRCARRSAPRPASRSAALPTRWPSRSSAASRPRRSSSPGS